MINGSKSSTLYKNLESCVESSSDFISPLSSLFNCIETQFVILFCQVLQNDIMAHESTVQSVNQAGQNFVASSDNRQVANVIRNKMDDVNSKWRDLIRKSEDRQKELEGALGEVREGLPCRVVRVQSRRRLWISKGRDVIRISGDRQRELEEALGEVREG